MRVTLLASLKKALNQVNGNTMILEEDAHYDEYFCTDCKNRVYEEKYNHKHSVCFDCFYKGE